MPRQQKNEAKRRVKRIQPSIQLEIFSLKTKKKPSPNPQKVNEMDKKNGGE